MLSSMRIISWNIRGGGGSRIERIVAAIDGWQSYIVALSEFRAGARNRLTGGGPRGHKATASAHHGRP